MDNLSQIIDKLYVKVEKLISSHKSIEEKNIEITNQNKELLKKIEEQKKQIEKLLETNAQLKIIKNLKETNVNTLDVKLKINELVREVDTCIAILNR